VPSPDEQRLTGAPEESQGNGTATSGTSAASDEAQVGSNGRPAAHPVKRASRTRGGRNTRVPVKARVTAAPDQQDDKRAEPAVEEATGPALVAPGNVAGEDVPAPPVETPAAEAAEADATEAAEADATEVTELAPTDPPPDLPAAEAPATDAAPAEVSEGGAAPAATETDASAVAPPSDRVPAEVSPERAAPVTAADTASADNGHAKSSQASSVAASGDDATASKAGSSTLVEDTPTGDRGLATPESPGEAVTEGADEPPESTNRLSEVVGRLLAVLGGAPREAAETSTGNGNGHRSTVDSRSEPGPRTDEAPVEASDRLPGVIDHPAPGSVPERTPDASPAQVPAESTAPVRALPRASVPARIPDAAVRPQVGPPPRRRARKVSRIVRRVDPWSVLKISFAFLACLFVVFMVAGVVLWTIAVRYGLINNIENFFEEIGFFDNFSFDGDVIFKTCLFGGMVLVVAGALFNVLLAVLFNLISDVFGGIRITVLEEESAVEVPAGARNPRPAVGPQRNRD
jgi:hypothetical protein